MAHRLHILIDGLVLRLGVYLRCAYVRMTEHLGNTLDRDMVAQRQRCEGVACQMRRQMLFDSCEVGNLFEICVHLLVGYDRKHHIFLDDIVYQNKLLIYKMNAVILVY